MVDKKRGVFSERKKKASGKSWITVKNFVLGEAKPLLAEIKKRKINDPIRRSLTNYLIVRTVTIFEVHHLSHALRLAKQHPRKARKLFSDLKTNATIADQVISSFNFSNIEDVKHVFSTILNENYFDEIMKESVIYGPYYWMEHEHIPQTRRLHENWNDIVKIFEYRNDIVHNNKLVDLKFKEIRDLIGGLLDFLLCSILIIP